MKYPLAAAVVLVCGLVHAQAGNPQEPEPYSTTPVQSAPQAAQPDPDAQKPETIPPEQKATPKTETQSSPEVQPPGPPSPAADFSPDSSQKPATSTVKKKPRTHKAKKSAPPQSTPTKKVVSNGGTSEPEIQISPRLTNKQQADQKQKISSLLSVAETNLQKVAGRQLKAGEEEMAKQIRMFMDQAKQASEAGDLQRAQNFASKANLLSVELVGK